MDTGSPASPTDATPLLTSRRPPARRRRGPPHSRAADLVGDVQGPRAAERRAGDRDPDCPHTNVPPPKCARQRPRAGPRRRPLSAAPTRFAPPGSSQRTRRACLTARRRWQCPAPRAPPACRPPSRSAGPLRSAGCCPAASSGDFLRRTGPCAGRPPRQARSRAGSSRGPRPSRQGAARPALAGRRALLPCPVTKRSALGAKNTGSSSLSLTLLVAWRDVQPPCLFWDAPKKFAGAWRCLPAPT